MDLKFSKVTRKGPITTITLSRPEVYNALHIDAHFELNKVFDDFSADPDQWVAIVTGAGDKAFCAGMDLRGFAAAGNDSTGGREATESFMRLLRAEFATPLIGAVNGTAMAGGFELMLACDIVVAADHAKFGLPEVKRGLIAAGTGVLLGARMPLAAALELTLTGDPIDAARAYELGLVNRVRPAADVLPAALAIAEAVAANGPLAVKATRELVRQSARDVTAAEERLRHWQQVIFSSEDAREGSAAFVEKRPPVWKGR